MAVTIRFQIRTFTVFLAGLLLFGGATTTTTIAAKDGPTYYHADMGQYGAFEMEISSDDSSMGWKTFLTNIDRLQQQLGLGVVTAADPDQPQQQSTTTTTTMIISALNYHLHQQWTNADANYAIGADACSAAVTGGHYDPFFACGPATGVPADQCAYIGKNTSLYSCTPSTYENGAYSACEVGDLSAKYGPIPVVVVSDVNGGTTATVAASIVSFDPLSALDLHYQDDRLPSPTADRFASIVFHHGSPRILCAKIMVGKLPQGMDQLMDGSAVMTPPTPSENSSASPSRWGMITTTWTTTTTIILIILSIIA